MPRLLEILYFTDGETHDGKLRSEQMVLKAKSWAYDARPEPGNFTFFGVNGDAATGVPSVFWHLRVVRLGANGTLWRNRTHFRAV